MKNKNKSASLPVMSVDTLESLPFGAVFVDNEGLILYGNPKFQEMFVGGDKDVSDRHIHDLLCRADENHDKDKCILINPIQNNVYFFRQPKIVYDFKGKKIWVEFSTYPVLKNGHSEGFFITLTPASVLLLSDDSYHTMKAKFRAFFEAGPMAKLIIDDHLKIVDVNQRAYTLTRATDLVNRPLVNFFPDDQPAAVEKFFKKLIGVNIPEKSKFRYMMEGREVFLEVFIHPHFIPRYHALLLVDITAAEMAQRRREMYLNTVGHELKNPVTVIKAYAQMLIHKAAKPGNEILVKYLKTIDSKTDVLTKLINDLVEELTISAEKMKLTFALVDIDRLVTDTVEEYKRTESNHRFVVKGSTRVSIQADSTRIQQVLGNLLANASKYSPADTAITVKLKKTGKEVIISITDQGHGIPESTLNKVFEPFYRGKPVTSEKIHGLGLGLYISQQIIRQHKGRIWLDSQPGLGTTAYVGLPL